MTLRRVAYVVNVFPKLSETFIANELVELRRRGVQVRVVSLRQPTETLRHSFIHQAGLDAVTTYAGEDLTRALRAFSPQVIHAHFATEPAAAARELAAGLEVPFTFTAHGYDIRRKPPADFAARAAAARAVVTVSRANAQFIAETFGVPRRHLRVIPCGVDTACFRPAERSSHEPAGVRPSPGAEPSECQAAPKHSKALVTSLVSTPGDGRTPVQDPKEPQMLEVEAPHELSPVGRQPFAAYAAEGCPLIVCVARQVAVKNLGLLLEACSLLEQRQVAFRLALVGDGPCRTGLEAKCAQLELNEHVEFAGAVDHAQVLAWWQRASIAVLSSHSEGMPVCLMEAAACGVPAVATAVGGIPELVEHGVTGLLVPQGDAEKFADALQRLIEHPDRTATMGRAARRRVEQHFSLRQQIDSLLGLWAEVV